MSSSFSKSRKTTSNSLSSNDTKKAHRTNSYDCNNSCLGFRRGGRVFWINRIATSPIDTTTETQTHIHTNNIRKNGTAKQHPWIHRRGARRRDHPRITRQKLSDDILMNVAGLVAANQEYSSKRAIFHQLPRAHVYDFDFFLFFSLPHSRFCLKIMTRYELLQQLLYGSIILLIVQ